MSNEIETTNVNGLDTLRKPFLPNQISKLPKPTRKQTDEVKADFKKGIRCEICGGWHHPKVIHLDYVGHAALTDRLLDVDSEWNWEPLSINEVGLPVTDDKGGMWIKLTVCGVTRMGYGCADGKTGGDAVKEVIGDALRNAAMRFGAALDLWHKGDLHIDDEEPRSTNPIAKIGGGMKECMDEEATQTAYDTAITRLNDCKSIVELQKSFKPYIKQGVFSDVQWKAIGKLKDQLKVKLPNVAPVVQKIKKGHEDERFLGDDQG